MRKYNLYKNDTPISIKTIDTEPSQDDVIPCDEVQATNSPELEELKADLGDNFWERLKQLAYKRQKRMKDLSNKLWVYHQSKKTERMLKIWG